MAISRRHAVGSKLYGGLEGDDGEGGGLEDDEAYFSDRTSLS